MRKWHRWLSVLFGVVLLWVAVTGLLSQVPLVGEVLGIQEERPAAAAAVPAGFKCPETMICRPKPPQGGYPLGLIHHLHSGETFGAAGTVIFTLAGLAMVFFSFSGLWLYFAMWSNRKNRGAAPKWFWK